MQEFGGVALERGLDGGEFLPLPAHGGADGERRVGDVHHGRVHLHRLVRTHDARHRDQVRTAMVKLCRLPKRGLLVMKRILVFSFPARIASEVEARALFLFQ